MKIYKNNFIENLDKSSFVKGDIIVSKCSIDNYFFEVNVLDDDDTGIDILIYKSLGIFKKLNLAISFANFYSNNTNSYEYYFQSQDVVSKEGGHGSNPNIDVMGDLGWELCCIDSESRMFIYKRIKIR